MSILILAVLATLTLANPFLHEAMQVSADDEGKTNPDAPELPKLWECRFIATNDYFKAEFGPNYSTSGHIWFDVE